MWDGVRMGAGVLCRESQLEYYAGYWGVKGIRPRQGLKSCLPGRLAAGTSSKIPHTRAQAQAPSHPPTQEVAR